MKRNKTYVIMTIMFIVCILSINSFAQDNQKLAQSGFQFLSVASDARAAALAEAMTSRQIGSSALFFNPAGMSEMEGYVDISASVNQWIADISHYTFSAAIKPFNGNYGVFGFSIQSVDYGEFYGTRVDQSSDLGYVDTGIFELNSMAVGVGYAKAITDRFSIGGQVKWVHQDLGESVIPVVSDIDTAETTTGNELSPFVFDFGTQFKTGIKSLVFGMSVRNFSAEVEYAKEGIQAPLVFTLGISMDVMDLFSESSFEQSLYVSIDANHHRDHPEQVRIGIDYTVMNVVSFRGGYVSEQDETDLTFGVGISHYGFMFDYSYTPYGIFDDVQRMTVRFTL